MLASVGLLLLTGCGASWQTFRADRVSIRYPPGWFATSRPLTPVISPRQVVAVASYPLPRGNSGADGCEPKEALDRLPASGTFIFGWEYTDPQLSLRSASWTASEQQSQDPPGDAA